MKILFVATCPNQPIGYSKIANKLSNILAENHEIYYFAFADFKETRIKRDINASIKFIDMAKDAYGVDIFLESLLRVDPDIVFFYNDCIVVSRLLNEIIKYREVYKQRF